LLNAQHIPQPNCTVPSLRPKHALHSTLSQLLLRNYLITLAIFQTLKTCAVTDVMGKRAKMENIEKEISNLPNTRFSDLWKEQHMT
jgi:hypothetical protein